MREIKPGGGDGGGRGRRECACLYVTPREERIRTLWRFLGPSDPASAAALGLPSDFESDLYTAAMLMSVWGILGCKWEMYE